MNLLLHAGSSAAVASLLLWMARRARSEHPWPAALCGALFFGVTPMAVETVAYVSSRSSGLSALLSLLALRLGVAGISQRRPARVAAALACFGLGLLSKEEALAVPLLLVLLDYFFIACLSLRDLRGRVLWHLPFFLLPLLALLLRRGTTGAWLPAPALDRGRYLLTQWALYPQYLLRSLVPVDPAFYRGHPAASWPPQAWLIAGCLASALILLAAIRYRRRFSSWSFAAAWLAASLVPSSSLVPLKEMLVDHRAYLGGAGVAAAVGSLWRPGYTPLAAGVLGLLSLRSVLYQRVLNDPVRAWGDAVRRAPGSAEAWRALADAYLARGDTRAEDALRAAVALDPGDAPSWSNLGALLVERDRLEEAEAALRRAAVAAPEDARVRDNLGMLLARLGRDEEALAEFEAACAGRPRIAQPRINLAALLLRLGDKARARALVEEAKTLEIDSEDARAIEALAPRLR